MLDRRLTWLSPPAWRKWLCPTWWDETQAAATTAITTAGLVLGTVTTQSSSTVPSGSVISENPAAGTEVNVGSAVNLVVSSGPVPLSAANLNLIFVVSGDLAYQAAGDINPQTANLTSQGLNRSLLMATYLQQNVLGSANVTGIYALEPMTHLQTTSNYPDMAALETIQQFALLNHITISSTANGGDPLPGNSFPLNASYAPAPVTPPSGVATPLIACPSCQGIDFNDQGGDNETLVKDIVSANVPGFYVFSAPWETTSALLTNINNSYSYGLAVPTSYAGPNYIYAISIDAVGKCKPAHLQQRSEPALHLPHAALAAGARQCVHGDAFQHRSDWRRGRCCDSRGGQYQRDSLHHPPRRGPSGAKLGRRQLYLRGAMAGTGPSQRTPRQDQPAAGLCDRPRPGFSGLRERLRRVRLVVCQTRIDGRTLRNRQ